MWFAKLKVNLCYYFLLFYFWLNNKVGLRILQSWKVGEWLGNLLFHKTAGYPDMYTRYPGVDTSSFRRSERRIPAPPVAWKAVQAAEEKIGIPKMKEEDFAKVAVPPPIPEEMRRETVNPFERKDEKKG